MKYLDKSFNVIYASKEYAANYEQIDWSDGKEQEPGKNCLLCSFLKTQAGTLGDMFFCKKLDIELVSWKLAQIDYCPLKKEVK